MIDLIYVTYLFNFLFGCSYSGPCYRGKENHPNPTIRFNNKFLFLGVSLPRNILDLFPEQHHSGTYVSRCIQDFETLESNHLSASSILAKNVYPIEGERGDEHQISVPIESNISSTSDLSASQRRMRKKNISSTVGSVTLLSEPTAPSLASSVATFPKHTKSECLNCCRLRVLNKSLDTLALNIQEEKDLVSHNGKNRESDVSFYSPESIMSDDSGNTNMPDRISNTILRNVIKMANPIMFKACRKILMELKQKFPQSFQDICLYSEICKHMAQCSYRMNVRRFIQEIFLDLNYEELASGVENILEVAQQRFTEFKHLNSSKLLPSTSPIQSPANYSPSQPPISISSLKIHSLKSPLLASVYETSVENLMDSPPQITKDEVDAVMLRTPIKKKETSPGGSTQVTAEVHAHRHSMESRVELLEPLRRRRFNTLELDLSCTKNKFPIKHRSPTSDEPLASSTLRRPTSLNTNQESHQTLLYKSKFSTSEHSFERASRKTFLSPLSPPYGTLFCEQRLLTSRSEATLSNKKSNFKKADERKLED